MTWKTLFNDSYCQQKTLQKLKDAEVRLNSSIPDLFDRWINKEQVPKKQVLDKLDININVFNKLIEHFNLEEQVEINKKFYLGSSANRSKFVISNRHKE
jgi:hypothetical protein